MMLFGSSNRFSIATFFLLLLLLLSVSAPFAKSDAQQLTDPCATAAATTSASCPIRCFRADPVCGANGVTYWCGCPEAACEGVSVAKRGYCEVGNGGSGQALLLVHIVWLIVVGFSVAFGFF